MYSDPGDGSGDFEPVSSNKTVSFYSDDVIASNGDLCIMGTNTTNGSFGSYTMGSPNSITYTHRGQPIVLSKFYTRILQPNRTVPEQLGDDNTVFIEIIRNNEFYLMKKQLEIQQEIEEEAQAKQTFKKS